MPETVTSFPTSFECPAVSWTDEIVETLGYNIQNQGVKLIVSACPLANIIILPPSILEGTRQTYITCLILFGKFQMAKFKYGNIKLSKKNIPDTGKSSRRA